MLMARVVDKVRHELWVDENVIDLFYTYTE